LKGRQSLLLEMGGEGEGGASSILYELIDMVKKERRGGGGEKHFAWCIVEFSGTGGKRRDGNAAEA